jgi:hypothetical protein
VINTEAEVLKVLKKLNTGEGFEVGDLFHRLPSEEKVYWECTNKVSNSKSTQFKFKLSYRGIWIRSETLTITGGKLRSGIC